MNEHSLGARQNNILYFYTFEWICVENEIFARCICVRMLNREPNRFITEGEAATQGNKNTIQ